MTAIRRLGAIVVPGLVVSIVVVLTVRWIFDVGADPNPDQAPSPRSGGTDPEIVLDSAAGLLDRSESVLVGRRFTPDSPIAAVLCGRAAHLILPAGDPITSRCDTGTLVFAGTDTQGNLELAVALPRQIRVGADTVDCAEEACLLRVVNLDDPTEDETIPVSFDRTASSTAPPTLIVDPGPVGHRSTITVSGVDLRALGRARIVQCVMSSPNSWTNCENPTITHEVEIDESGRLHAEVEVSRYVGTSRGWFDCAALDAGVCVLTLQSLPETDEGLRLPSAVPLVFDPDEPPPVIEAVVEHTTDLVDGQAVTISFDSLHMRSATRADPGLAVCRTDDPVCVNLDRLIQSSGLTVWLTARLPRRFTAPTGETYETVDCLETACAVRLLIAPGEHADVPIAFDPDAALRPALIPTLTAHVPLAPAADVTVVLPAPRGTIGVVGFRQCVVGADDICERIQPGTRSEVSGALELSVTVYRLLVMGDRTHDCALDGPCELKTIPAGAGALRQVEAVPLTFAGDASLRELAHAAIRPGHDLRAGEQVQVHIRGAPRDGPAHVELCHADSLRCVLLARVEVAGGSAVAGLAVPGVVVADASAAVPARPLHCAPDRCRLRVMGNGRIVAVAPLRFDPDQAVLDGPELALDPAGIHAPGTRVVLLGRRFELPALSIGNGGRPVSARLCSSTETGGHSAACRILDLGPAEFDKDGAFEAVFEVPTVEAVGRNLADRRIGLHTYRLVVESTPGLRFATATLRIRGEAAGGQDRSTPGVRRRKARRGHKTKPP